MYERRGREDGHDIEDWLRAEAEITSSKPSIQAAQGRNNALALDREKRVVDRSSVAVNMNALPEEEEVSISRPRILCLSYDDTVSKYRQKALGEGGYDVVATSDPKEASRLLSIERPDLVVIGHRFSVRQKKDLISQAKKFGPIPVLLVCGASSDSELAVDGRVYALQGAEGLLAGVAKLLLLTTAA